MSIRKLAGIRLLLAVALAAGLGACGSGHLASDRPDAGQPFDPGVSPGSLTFHLSLPTNRTFCDRIDTCAGGPTHFSFVSLSSGALLWPNAASWCPMICSDECVTPPCPAIPCGVDSIVALTELETTWDGSHYESATCGNNVACSRNKFVAPGAYLVEMCATPGTVTRSDAGVETCTPMGLQECVAVPFTIPGPPVTATLPP